MIIGNGFDIHHGYHSSFEQYKKWLETAHPNLLTLLKKYIDVSGEWWKDFERNLAEFNLKTILSDTPSHHFDYHVLDPRIPPMIMYPANTYFEGIRKEIGNSFQEWIQALNSDLSGTRETFKDVNLYISFNYTDTLEKLYGVPESKILYIHGKSGRDAELIFGHNKTKLELEFYTQEKYGLAWSDDFHKPGSYGEVEDELVRQVAYFDKKTYYQLVKYKSILEPAVKESSTVYVYGLSFSETDYDYLEWLAMRNPLLKWIASWHTEEDKEREIKFFAGEGIKNYELFFF